MIENLMEGQLDWFDFNLLQVIWKPEIIFRL